MDPALLVGLGTGAIAILGIGVWLSRSRKFDLDDIPPDDGKTCAACGGTQLTHPAEGVYVCSCGFEGGPGMAAYVWRLKAERLAAMPDQERAALRAKTEQDAQAMLSAARGDYESAARAFTQGDAITPLGTRGANRKTELFNEVRNFLPSAEQFLREAIPSVETVRLILRGGEPMTEWYDRLNGSRETALTVTGVQATTALRAQLQEVHAVLTGLESELAGESGEASAQD